MKSQTSLEGVSSPESIVAAFARTRIFRPPDRTLAIAATVLRTLLMCSVVSSSAVAADNDPQLLVQLARDRIYEGESVLYRIILRNVEDPPQPQLLGLDDFDVQSRGAQSLNRQHITMDENGNMTRVVQYGRAYDYLLTPKRKGELTIPAPTSHGASSAIRSAAGGAATPARRASGRPSGWRRRPPAG